MNIKISSISSKKDFVVSGEIPEMNVDEFFDGLENCHATTPIAYDAKLRLHDNFIALHAEIRALLELCCHRCGTSFEQKFNTEIDLRLVEASSIGGSDEIVLSEEDLDTVTFKGSQIDLDNILLESVYLEIDGSCICREDCKGICPQCGQNLNLGPCKCLNL